MEAGIAPRLLAVTAVFREGSGRTGSAPVKVRGHYLALLRILVAPRVEDTAERLRVVPELELLVPILTLLRQAWALPEPTVRLYFSALSPGRRRFEALARVNSDGLVILLIPRLGPFLSLLVCQRNSCPPRFVNIEPSIPVELESFRREGLVSLPAGIPALMSVERRDTSTALIAGLPAAGAASPETALVQRPSISEPFFSAHPSKSSEAEAGRAVAARVIRNNGTIDALK